MSKLISSLNNEDELDFDDPPSNIQEEYVTTFWYLDRRVREKVLQNYPKIVFFCFHGGFCNYQCSGNEENDLARINMHFQKNPDHRITRDMLGPWKEKARQRRNLRDARKVRLAVGGSMLKMTGANGVPVSIVHKESNKQRRSLSPSAWRRSKSPSISSLSISKSSKNTTTSSSRSRSPRSSRSSMSSRFRRYSDSIEHARSPSRRSRSPSRRSRSPSRRSRSPSRRSRSPDRRMRTPGSTLSSRSSRSPMSSRCRRYSDSIEYSRSTSRRSRSPSRRSRSPERRLGSPSARPCLSRRMFSSPRGHRRTRSPSGKERTIGNPKDSGHNSSSRAALSPARSNKRPAPRYRYSSKPGQMGRYNSRLEKGSEVEEERKRQPQEYTCKRCSEVFHIQDKYIKHVELSNIRRKCPEKELFVLDDSPPAVKGETWPSPLYSGPPTEIFLEDSPPYNAPVSPEEPQILPPSLSDSLDNVSDSDLPPIVPPPLLFSLDPISDQSLPTTPASTSPPVSMADIPSAQTDPIASPKFEILPKVILRSDGVLIFEDVLNESSVTNVRKLPKQMIKFAKNLFKDDSVPDLVDIPAVTVEPNGSETKQESKLKSAEVTDSGPPIPSECQDSDLIEDLFSANNLLMSLPDSTNLCLKSNLGVGKKRKLPECFSEFEEPKVVKNVKAPQPNDEMELLLDNRRKKLTKKKVKSKPKLNRVESSEKVKAKVSGVSDAGQVKPRNNQKFMSAILQAETTSFKSKNKKVVSKKSNERRKYKDKDKIRSLPCVETDLDSISQMPAEASRAIITPSSPVPRPAACSEPSTSHTNCDESKTYPSVPSKLLGLPSGVTSLFSVGQVSNSVSSCSPNSVQTSISTTDQTRLSSTSTSTSSSCSQTLSVSPTTTSAIYIPASLIRPVPSIPIPTANPTSLPNSLTPDSCTTSQVPKISLASAAANKNPSALPTPFSSALGLDDLAAKETANLAQDQKNGKLQFVDPVLGEYQMEWQLANSPEQSSSVPPASSPVTQLQSSVHRSVPVISSPLPIPPSHPSTPQPPPHQGEVMTLYQALGGRQDSEEEPEQPVVIRAGVDPMDKCPVCNAGLDIGPKALNFAISFTDLSVLVDCRECGVRVRLKGVLGAKQRAFLSCGM